MKVLAMIQIAFTMKILIIIMIFCTSVCCYSQTESVRIIPPNFQTENNGIIPPNFFTETEKSRIIENSIKEVLSKPSVFQKEFDVLRVERDKGYVVVTVSQDGDTLVLLSKDKRISKRLKKKHSYILRYRYLVGSVVANAWEYSEDGREAIRLSVRKKIHLTDFYYLCDIIQ